MKPHLTVCGVTKKYDRAVAVDDISFEVARGEFFTLLGPSGCGKSTTLGLIAGFVRPDSGSVHVHGRDITYAPPEDRNIGVVFQSYALFPHLTVLENVMFPLEMRKVPRAEAVQRARDALALVQLTSASAYPSEISGGQAQRVALARVLVFEPELLLMDEPLAALDRRLRQSMQFELREIQDRIGTTVVYVTHDQEEALVLSDRVALMKNGRFEQVGSPESIYNEPENEFVASFIGESNRARMRRDVSADGDTYVFVDAPGVRLSVAGSQANAGVVMIRPEHVAVSTDRADVPSRHQCFEAKVQDFVFLGDHVRIKLLLSGLPWIAKLDAFDARLPALREAANDQRPVWVHWAVERVRLLPDASLDDETPEESMPELQIEQQV